MALFRKPRRNQPQLTPNESDMNGFITTFADIWQVEEAVRWMVDLRGAAKTASDTDDDKIAKQLLFDRSDDWAAEMLQHLTKSTEYINDNYVNKIDDAAATAADTEVDNLVELYGADAVANALFDHADNAGNLGPQFRLIGKGAKRKAKDRRQEQRRTRRG